jgi:hypothetical protein
MPDKVKQTLARVLDAVELNRAEADDGPDNLWAMTLSSGVDERVYLLNADHLRLLAEEIFKRIAS